MSRRRDKGRSGIQSENKKLEREIEELEDALLLHKHIRHKEESGIHATLRKEIGGSRWEHGGQGKLRTYKSNQDLDERYGLVPASGTKQMEKAENERIKRRKEENPENGDAKLIKVGSVDRIRSSARARRDRQQREQGKSGTRPTSGKDNSNQPPPSEKPSREVTGPKRIYTTESKGKVRPQDHVKDTDTSLFATEPLKIDNLKDKVLQKASANVIKRTPPPQSNIEDVLKGHTLSDKHSSLAPASPTKPPSSKLTSDDKKLGSGQSKQQPNRKARESRHAARAAVEDYVNMVAGTSSIRSKDKSVKTNDGKSNLNQNRQNMDLIGRRAAITANDDLGTMIDVVERVNVNNNAGPSVVNQFPNKPPSREVLTSDYSSDLEISPDRWDDPQFGGTSFDREAWLSSMRAEAEFSESRPRERAPAPSDDISDTPVLGRFMSDFKYGNFDVKVDSKPECDPAVVLWLEGLRLRECDRYIDIFAENEIDMESLKDLTPEQLNQMGITAVGPVNKILRAVTSLKQSAPPDMTVDELLAAVGTTLKQSPRDVPQKCESKTAKLPTRIGKKKDFSFSDFAGEEGKDEIKKKLGYQNLKTQSLETETVPSVMKEDSTKVNTVQRDEMKRKPVSQRKSSLESKKDSRSKESLLEESKPTDSKQKTVLRRRSSSASRIQTDRERSLSSEGSTRGRQPIHPRSAQPVPKRLPSGKKTNVKDGSLDAKANVSKNKASNKLSEAAKKHAEAGISAAAQKREEMQQKSKKEMLEQQQQQDSRRKRRDKMAAKYTGRGRPDSRGTLQPSSRLADPERDPLEDFTLPLDPGNLGNRERSPRDVKSDEFPMRVEALLSEPHQTSVSSKKMDSPDEETLTAREKIRNVDIMVRDLQRKSVDKQTLTLGIVRDLQKQLEDIEKGLVSKTNDELPQEDSSPQMNSDQHMTEEVSEGKTTPKDRFPSHRGCGLLNKTSSDKTEVLEKDDTLHDLVLSKSKSKTDTVQLLTSTNANLPGQSSKSKGLQPSGVASMSMSKRELLDEIRKEKDEHRKQIRHLQSELTRLQHKDPVRKEEVDIKDVHYQEEDVIGEGAFSQVFRGHYQGAEVAVKRLKVPLSSQDKNYFAAEVSLLRDLRHPRVVLLIGVCTSRRLPVMVLEYMSKGNLFGLLHNPNRESLDHAEYYQIARDIAAGMVYLHNHRPSVLHLDLKSMNVLIGPMDRAKIADFGFSKLKHDADQKAAKNCKVKEQVQGSPAWMAPELLQAGEVTPKADVYSFGMILWEMLTRQVPYKGCSMFQILERVRLNKRPEIPSECPTQLSQFVSRCWDQNPAKRPLFKEVLSTLENLSFPPEWRDLFQQAGVPREALENVQSTRNIISLVTSTLESSKLASLLDATGQCQEASVLREESESESTEIDEDLEESTDLSDDSLESDLKGSSEVSSRMSSAGSHGEHIQDKGLQISNVNPYSNTTLHENFEKLSLQKNGHRDNSVDQNKPVPTKENLSKDNQSQPQDALINEMMEKSLKKSDLENNETKDKVKLRRNRVPSPESAVSKFSDLPTPRRSCEAWSSEDIPVPVPVTNFPHNHIPPPPAPPPPPPPPPPPQTSPPFSSTNMVIKKTKPGKSLHAPTLPNLLVTPQTLEAKSQKLKTTKRDKDERKGNIRPRVTPKPVKSALFAVGAADLMQQRTKLKSTHQPHPNQLEDLGQVNRVMLSSIAEILRDAMSERRFAMGEDPSASCDLDHTQSDVSWSTQDD